MAAEQETESYTSQRLRFLRPQMKLPYPTRTFTGQTIIVTGSNIGMGLEAARHFVRLDADKVILAVRSIQKGKTAAESIIKSEKRAESVVEVWELDLASYASTKKFAERANRELKRLDVVVANAGIYVWDFAMAEEDEQTITVNNISTFFMAVLLLPKLRETSVAYNKETVLTFTGSFVHFSTQFPERKAENIFKELADEKNARINDRYNVSKMIELFLLRELASKMDKSQNKGNVIASMINPGFVKTSIMRHSGPAFQLYVRLLQKVLSRTAEEGGRTLVFAAYGGSETHGRYLDDCKVGKVSLFIVGEDGVKTQMKLWLELSEKLERIEPGIMTKI